VSKGSKYLIAATYVHVHLYIHVYTFSVVASAYMEAVEQIVVVMFSDVHTASTQLYYLLHLHTRTLRNDHMTDCHVTRKAPPTSSSMLG
jgi:hypothetical protein